MGTDQLYFPYPTNVDHELVENLKVLNAFGRYCGLSGNNFIARVILSTFRILAPQSVKILIFLSALLFQKAPQRDKKKLALER